MMKSNRQKLQLAVAITAATLAPRAFAVPAFTDVNLTLTENFDSLGTSSWSGTQPLVTSTLPDGWRVDTTSPTVVYSAADTTTNRTAGTTGTTGTLSGTTSGGTYNFGNGDNATATDRAPGFLTSGSFGGPRDLFVKIDNASSQAIKSLAINFDYEKYRSGTRAQGFTMNFFWGTDGSNWNLLSDGVQSYAPDSDNTTVFNPPQTASKAVTLSGLNVAAGASLYLRWQYIVSSGSTYSSAQALAVDNFSATATLGAFTNDPNDLVWDPNGSTSPNPSDGTGTWTDSGLTWFQKSTGSTIAFSNAAPNNAFFGSGSGSGNFTVTLDSAKTVGKLAFVGTSPRYTLTGGSIQINGVAGVGIEADNSATIQSPVSLNGNQVASVSGANQLTLAGNVSGAALIKTGTGTLVLSDPANSFDHLELNGGTLLLSNPGQLGTNTAILGAGVLKITAPMSFAGNRLGINGTGTIDTNGFDVDYAGDLFATGSLVKNGAGTLRFKDPVSNPSFTGTVTINAGKLAIASVTTSGFTNEAQITSSGGFINVENGATFELQGVQYGRPSGSGSFFNNRIFLKNGATFSGVTVAGVDAAYYRPNATGGDSATGADALRVANGAEGSPVNVNLRADGAGSRLVIGNPVRQDVAAPNSTATDSFSTIHVTGGGKVQLEAGYSNNSTAAYYGSWAVDNGTLQVGPVRTGAENEADRAEPLNALGFKGGRPNQANTVTVNAAGTLAVATDTHNAFADVDGNGQPLPADQITPDYLRANVVLNGGSIASTGLRRDSLLVPTSDPVSAKFGGDLTANAGTSKVLAYDPATPARAMTVNLVANGATTWTGTLVVDPGSTTGGAFNIARAPVNDAPVGAVTVTPGAKLQVLAGAAVNLGGESDTLSSGAAHVDVANAGAFNVTLGTKNVGVVTGTGTTSVQSHLTVTSIAQSAVTLADATGLEVRTGSTFSRVGSLTIGAGSGVELNDNDLVVDAAGSFATLSAAVKAAYANGAWNGASSVTSSAAAADPKHVTALAVVQVAGSGLTTLDGVNITGANTLIKYTYYGDANLDGKVDSADVARASQGFAGTGAGWAFGDFNYDGRVSPDDFAILSWAAANQGAPLTAAVPEPASLAALATATLTLTPRRRRRAAR